LEKEQTKNQQEKNQKKSQKLQWHPAFCSALRLELLEDAENLELNKIAARWPAKAVTQFFFS